jgi:hypothetical protein
VDTVENILEKKTDNKLFFIVDTTKNILYGKDYKFTYVSWRLQSMNQNREHVSDKFKVKITQFVRVAIMS